jgi:hypothetical protein
VRKIRGKIATTKLPTSCFLWIVVVIGIVVIIGPVCPRTFAARLAAFLPPCQPGYIRAGGGIAKHIQRLKAAFFNAGG